MNQEDKRKNKRIDSHNLLAFSCLDENGEVVTQGMGRTLDVSEGGILLETHAPLDPRYSVSLSIGMEEDVMDFIGKVAYTRQKESGDCEAGIQFLDMDAEKARVLRQFAVIFKDEMAESL
ncbi:MAG: PilZ domain-containing protein [Deltaproteobacteria bacterium]|nr:PilZ domain-containing protein [Deltaproteobacteria bacterium]